MHRPYELFLGMRYLHARHRRGFISFISLISMLGIALGVAVLIVVLPLLALVFRYVIAEWLGIIFASAIVAHTAWHWLIDRGDALRQYDWSISGPAGLASLLRWVMVGVAVVGAVWIVRLWTASKGRREP